MGGREISLPMLIGGIVIALLLVGFVGWRVLAGSSAAQANIQSKPPPFIDPATNLPRAGVRSSSGAQ